MNRIRELRVSQNWTQAQLGKRIGVQKNTVSGYESGSRQPDIETIHALCDLFGCTADYLLCRSDTPMPVISDADARILAAYHAASVRDRALVDQILASTMPDSGSKEDVS